MEPLITSKIYTVTKIKQLVDLNGELTNFHLQFQVSSESNEPFEAVIVDQHALDHEEQLGFKVVEPGTPLEGTIETSDGIHRNFVLVLRSATPNTIRVELQTTPIEATEPPQGTTPSTDSSTDSSTGPESWRSILRAMILVFLIALVMYLVFQSKTGRNPSTRMANGSLLSRLQHMSL
jgi:hypothetical protein